MSRVTYHSRRSRSERFRPVSAAVLLGILAAVLLQLQAGLGLPNLLEIPAPVMDQPEAPAYIGVDAPQSVEYPSSEFAALADAAAEQPKARQDTVEYSIQSGDSLLTIAEDYGLRADTLV